MLLSGYTIRCESVCARDTGYGIQARSHACKGVGTIRVCVTLPEYR